MKPTPNMCVIDVVEGKDAPKYEAGLELRLEGVVITEKATVGDLPIVDFKMRGADGEFYLLVLTGSILQAIAGTLHGINYRNHGKSHP